MELFKSLKDKRSIMTCLLQKGKGRKTWGKEREVAGGKIFWVLERESLALSKFLRDPTVGGIRDKKESCSTRRGLRMGTRFRKFPQTP